MAGATITTATRWCAAATVSCPSTSMCRGVRRRLRRSSTASFSFSGRFAVPARSCDDAASHRSPARNEKDGCMTEALSLLGRHLEERRPDCVTRWGIAHDELTVEIVLPSVTGFVEFLKTDNACRFSTLVDITAIDHPEREKRFEVVYHFLSMYQNHRVRVKTAVREREIVPSIIGIFPSANWFEREVFDMFGILFS